MWFLQIVRSFFYTLDSTLFNFIPTVYDLLITISRTTILSQGQIKMFADRIQMLLGVFMLFKVSFSLITYIINPDDFSDKSKGFGKLWMNIVITLLMLVLVPYAFSMAYELQALILEDNAIGTLILGQKTENNYINTAGQNMAYTVMIPFFMPDVSNPELTSCINMVNEAGDFDKNCSDGLYKASGLKEPDTMIENYKMGVENSSLGLTFRLDIAKETVTSNGNGAFLINYNAPISTVVAVVVLLLLITFCMDVALRSVKLAFLQLISPIPIISFIDPKSGKDGIFKKWYQMCFSTYVSLFVRLVALYFGIYIISQVNGMHDVINGSEVSNPWVNIFIIIGVLMFVKQLPKILEGLGIKLDGAKFQLNPFKKFEEEAAGGKQILGAGAAGLAGVAALGTNTLNLPNRWRNAKGTGFLGHAAAVLSPVGGLIGGTRRGLVGAARGEKFGQVFSNSYKGAMMARQDREARNLSGVGLGESLVSRAQQAMGVETRGMRLGRETQDLEEFSRATSGLKAETESMVQKRKADLKMTGYTFKNEDAGKKINKDVKDMSVAEAERTVQILENYGYAEDAAALSNAIALRQKDISDAMQEVAFGKDSAGNFSSSYLMSGAKAFEDSDFAKAMAYSEDAKEIADHSSVVQNVYNSIYDSTKTLSSNYMKAGKEAENRALSQKGETRREQTKDQHSRPHHGSPGGGMGGGPRPGGRH